MRPRRDDPLALAVRFSRHYDFSTMEVTPDQWKIWILERHSTVLSSLHAALRTMESADTKQTQSITTVTRALALLTTAGFRNLPVSGNRDTASRELLTALTAYQSQRLSREQAILQTGHEALRREVDRRLYLLDRKRAPIVWETVRPDRLQREALSRASLPSAAARGRDLAWRLSEQAWDRQYVLGDYLLAMPTVGDGTATNPQAVELPIEDEPDDSSQRAVTRPTPLAPPEPPPFPGRSFTVAGGPILNSPTSATVLFSGHLRGWGETVILDTGNRRSLTITGLRKRSVRPNEMLSPGDPLGEAGNEIGLSVRIGEEETGLESLFGTAPPLEAITRKTR